MNFRRILIVFVGAVGVIYLAAFAAANPDSFITNLIIYGLVAFVIILPLIHYLKLWQIIKNAFGRENKE